MSEQTTERRPRPDIEGDAKNTGGRSAHHYSLTPANIAAIPDAMWTFCLEFYASGYAAGVDRGRQLEHDEVAALQREAARIVHALAEVPSRDRDVDRARRARIDARFEAMQTRGGAA